MFLAEMNKVDENHNLIHVFVDHQICRSFLDNNVIYDSRPSTSSQPHLSGLFVLPHFHPHSWAAGFQMSNDCCFLQTKPAIWGGVIYGYLCLLQFSWSAIGPLGGGPSILGGPELEGVFFFVFVVWSKSGENKKRQSVSSKSNAEKPRGEGVV